MILVRKRSRKPPKDLVFQLPEVVGIPVVRDSGGAAQVPVARVVVLVVEWAAGSLPLKVRLLGDPHDIPGLMAWADVAISGAGSTCWELAFMGLPAAVLVLADNQRGIAAGLAEYGTAINLGEAAEATDAQIADALCSLLGDRGLRARMSRKGKGLIDGRGAERVAEHLRQWPASA